MNKNKHFSLKLYALLVFTLPLFYLPSLTAQPAGFTDQTYVSGFAQAVGLTFDDNGRMYVWEKGGKIWIVENGVRLPNPLIDISEEVGNWRDFGLLGVALDPNFLSNGRIYLLYIVDRHHLLHFGTGNYNPNTNEYFNATIGRITRYEAEASTNFTTVNYNSRTILMGDAVNNGFPNLHQSHGTGSLVFGTDGTLLASLGDGASYSSRDEGSASETYYAQALADGIITPAENVGAYRCQMMDSYNGKVIRIDPETGEGVSSNPFYQSGNPNSVQSKIWALGVRNPCRMIKKPNTGSHNSADANPGVFFIGDVGWGSREEFNVMDAPGQNFGWPKYEGMTHQPGYNNPAFTPPSHELAKADWRTGTPRAYKNGQIVNIGSGQVPGLSFGGNSSIGGVWYDGTSFPPEWQNTYFHADYGGDWIKAFDLDANNELTQVRDFKAGADRIVFVSTDPITGDLYYIGGAQGNSNNTANVVRRIFYTGNIVFPVAKAEANILYGSSPLIVEFSAAKSYDPDGANITFFWDFGDGSTSQLANPTHTFTGSGVTSFPVTLTVTNELNQTDQANLMVSLNNTPPNIISTSIDNTNTFPFNTGTTLNLSATVSDAEHSAGQLSYTWVTALYHNDHSHPEAPDNNASTSTVLSPIGCDGATYWYRVFLTVTDAGGLYSTYFKDIYPNCPGQSQTISFGQISDKFSTAAPFNLNATASSGLSVISYIESGPATISGNTITLTGEPGTVNVHITQPGDLTYAPAPALERSFEVTFPTAGGTGLSASYYDNIDFTNLTLERTDPVVDFDWGSFSPDPSMGANTFSIVWEGEIEPIYSQNYTFITTTDDGVRLWVDGQQIIDQWVDQSATPHAGSISLTAGQRVPIRMEYYENGGGASAILEWESSSQSREVIPQGYLFPPANSDTTPPDVTLSTASNNVSGPFLVDAVFTEDVTGLSLADFDLTNGTASGLSGSGANYSFTVTPIAEGNVSILLPANRAEDAAANGNTVSNTLNVTYTIADTTPPDVTLSTASSSVNAPFSVDVTFTENITGLALNDFTISNGTGSALSGSGANYSFTVTPISQGQVTITLPADSATDAAGNGNTVSNTLNVNYSTGGGGSCNSVENIALNKTATQSSEHPSTPGPAERAVDGNTSGNWWLDFSVTSTAWENEAWWEVDLGEIGTIEDINVWNRTDCCQSFLSDFYVLVSDVPFSSTGLNATINQAGVSNYHVPGMADRPTTVGIDRTGRFVRIQKGGSGFMALAEVEIMGCFDTGPDVTPPDVTLSTPNSTVNSAFTVTADFTEDVTGLALGDFNITNGNASNLSGSGNQYTFTITPIAEGNVSILLPANSANDAAGNGNTVSNTLNVTYSTADITPPDVTLSTASSTVNAPFLVDVAFSENVTGLALNNFTISNGTGSALSGSGANYSFTVTPSNQGLVTISLPANSANDTAGNGNTVSNTLNVTFSTGGGGGTCGSVSNIAVNKTASQSSEHPSTPGPAERAVDGNTSGNWWADFSVTSTAWENTPWWEVDLGEIGTIEEINVWNRSDCCQSFLTDFYVFVSDVPFSSTDLNSTINQSGVFNHQETGEAQRPTTIPVDRTGRYIRVQKNGSGFMALAEVEVMGCFDTGPDTTPPDVTLSTANTDVNGPFIVNANFTESITGLALSDFNISNGTASALSGSSANYSFTVTPTAEGTVAIDLPANQVTDAAGNGNTASNTLNVNYTIGGGDTTPPEITLSTASNTVTEPFTVDAVFSETITGLTLSDFTISNGTASALSGSGANYSFTVTPTTEGLVTVQLPANQVTDAAGNGNNPSNTLNITFTTGGGGNPPTGYCASQGNSPWVEWISNVTFGTINNDSGKDLYGNYTNLSTTVIKGMSYELSVTPKFSWTQYDEYVRVWIDFNRDGDFEDTGEQVLSGISPGGSPQSLPTVINGLISIPATAGDGPTRMRVSMQRGAYPEPCETFSQGEVEDYLVNLANSFQTETPDLRITNDDLDGILLFPNPVDMELFVHLQKFVDMSCSMLLFDSNGKLLLTQHLGRVPDDPMLLDMSGYSTGVYFLKVKADGFEEESHRVVITR